MADLQRLEELRRRVHKDPASLAFAQLAEEYRRAGQHHEAVYVCRAGLAHHPDYLSARVTLGRSLLALGHLDQARAELAGVLRDAPENLAALRGLAEVYQRQGLTGPAREYYTAALALAPQDQELAAALASLGPPATPAAVAQGPRPVPASVGDPPAPAAPLEATRGVSHAPAALPRLERWLEVLERRRRMAGES